MLRPPRLTFLHHRTSVWPVSSPPAVDLLKLETKRDAQGRGREGGGCTVMQRGELTESFGSRCRCELIVGENGAGQGGAVTNNLMTLSPPCIEQIDNQIFLVWGLTKKPGVTMICKGIRTERCV